MSSDDTAPDFSRCVLGETRGLITLDTREQNRLAALSMAQQSQHTLRITSRDLDPALYDNDDFIEAAKALALRTHRAKLFILVNTSDPAIKNGHRIIDLSRRLTSFIEIRLQGMRFQEYNEAVLIADESGYMRRRLADRYETEADFASPRTAREMTKKFDEMWAESIVDPNLRRLHI